jgi:hypothetical protein
MVTTIIAIYGAVLSTVSTLLGIWYFSFSGPRLQAEASIFSPISEDAEQRESDWCIELRVWNTGRGEVTVNIDYVVIHYDDDKTNLLLTNRDLDGPDVPIRILGHSGESWTVDLSDIRSMIGHPFVTATLSVVLVVGGKREVDVPVSDGWYRDTKHPFILKPA